MKTNFKTVLFSDECLATLDGPDGLRLVISLSLPARLHQQGGGRVMNWGEILGGNKIIFMQDNTPSHVAQNTFDSLLHHGVATIIS